jgi:hypothetical protein
MLTIQGTKNRNGLRIRQWFIGVVVIGSFFTCCLNDTEQDREKDVVVTIYPETGYGAGVMSDIWTQPLVFSDNDDNQKHLLMNIIFEGLNINYERGYQYTFTATKVWMHTPPQDVSYIKFVCSGPVSKEKVITKDSEENIELYVYPKAIKYTPAYPVEYEGTGSSPKIYNALLGRVTGTNDFMALVKIEGFDFEEGYEYELNVKKITYADPYSVKYVLVNIKSKTLKE